MQETLLYFSREEYAERKTRVHHAMAEQGIDLLLATDPSNMAWLTGYDGWSFYTHQCVILPLGEEPIWFGREMDAKGALRTVYMSPERILGYPDEYVMSTERHPMDYLSAILRDRHWDHGRVSVEMDNYYFSAACYASLQKNLPDTRFVDATVLVNWQRAVKSTQEIAYMRQAARIVESTHARALAIIEPGMRKNDLIAEIYHCSITGVDGHGGDYPAIVPLVPTGADASAPHLTWDDRPIPADSGTFLELAGCFHRYHCPVSRTIYLGMPPQKWRHAEQAIIEALAAALDAARPGNTCEEVSIALNKTLSRYGLTKDSRCAYPIGLSYPPDWGERTMSMRAGDHTVLQPGMTFHLMPGLWFDDWGIEITESILITEAAAQCLANIPRKLFVKS
ncbi:MAG TPA: ectoine hydrolase DoeA [Gammaproteobacteria bacterium]|nr:ectoine hydrolase DoeA [Gammaproteobacteria bacterium]